MKLHYWEFFRCYKNNIRLNLFACIKFSHCGKCSVIIIIKESRFVDAHTPIRMLLLFSTAISFNTYQLLIYLIQQNVI